ncbi:hypothetical protein SNE40_004726 [Patella caerulea]|uniref:PLAC domain-containing protein n=1 Tax=Patella caerulea TaxID=87958 RepID=A0AAN8K3L3_PATCE
MGCVTPLPLVYFLLFCGNLAVTSGVEETDWGPWTDWSVCSKSCDQGVIYRQRHCHTIDSDETQSSSSSNSKCIGDKKQFKVCQIQRCPPHSVDVSVSECSKHDNQIYGGKKYTWEPFRNPYNRCDLSCKAKGHHYYSRMKKTLSDGTPCKHDGTSYCLAGECLAVGCDGILGSKTKLDQCGVCGGNGKSCQVVSGIFTRSHLTKYGHNFVTKIPKGACNINITEMAKSRNYIALKITDGDYVIDHDQHISHTGTYQAAGTEFRYYRNTGGSCPGECIYATGPTDKSIDVEILYYHHNPGIIYQFTIPHDMVSQLGIPPPPADTTSKHVTRNHRDGRKHHRKHKNGHNKHHNRKHRKKKTTPHDDDEDEAVPEEQRDDVLVGRSNSRTVKVDDRYIIRRRTDADRLTPRIQFGQSPRYIPSARQGYQQQVLGRSHTNHHRNQLGSTYLGRDTDYGSRQSVVGRTGQYVPNSVLTSNPNSDITLPNGYTQNSYNQLVNGLEDHDKSVLDTSGLYSWKISGFTECSHSCGGGTQEARILCVKGTSNAVVTKENCDPATIPAVHKVNCNSNPCPADWHTGNWSACSVTCGSGKQTRLVECRRRISPTLAISVSASLCISTDRPHRTKKCENDPCATWNTGHWSKCSTNCGHGQRTREVRCVDIKGQTTDDQQCGHHKPDEEEICDMGSCAKGWYHSRWSDECSTDCGRGFYTRNIYCAADDGTSLPERKCSIESKPKTRKSCKSPKPCGGNWFAGPWNKCNATCGIGAITRGVVCMKKLRSDVYTIVKDENCLIEEKPESVKGCDDLPPCGPTWYMTEYTQCTKTCGSGVKRREVKCLNANLQPDITCNKKKRPAERQSCNKESCKKANFSLQKDSGGDRCKDSYPSWCQFVRQARICGYKYYQKQCCQSCQEYL